MKKVFSNANDAIHVFAQRTQSEGRCSNVFFEGNKLYSYGHHYLLAEFVTNSKNETAVMINDLGYSQTTSKHISIAMSALSQYKRFYTTLCLPKNVMSTLNQLSGKLQKARKPEIYIAEAERLMYHRSEYLNWTNGKEIKEISQIYNAIKDFKIAGIESILEYNRLIEKQRKQKEISDKRKAKRQLSNELKEFNEYKRNRIYARTEFSFLRLSLDGNSVETSQGVRVPKKDANVLYGMIQAGKDIKGHKIDGWTVISLNGTLKIGCHNIPRQEVDRIGLRLTEEA